jgi:aldehyde dehydrogenase (NAD+)
MANDPLKSLGIARDPRLLARSARTATLLAEGKAVDSLDPATGKVLGTVRLDGVKEYERAVKAAQAVQHEWAMLPAPKRGEIVRLMGEAFREHKAGLGELVTREMGKILPEGLGEVQECIDIADFAVGLSRQLYGLTMHSERTRHRMYEQWHPLGTVGIITAFNFPAAVWAWNAMIAAVCGDTMVWKPSLVTPLTAIAMNRIAQDVMRRQDVFVPSKGRPEDVFGLVIGNDADVGETMIADRRLPLISATGSTRMGRRVGQVVAGRLGRALLELGGNNAIIVMPDADMDLVVRAVLFGAVGTAGQRCTTTRRLIVHKDVAAELTKRLVKAYRTVPIGDPMRKGTLMGPLINARAVQSMRQAIAHAERDGCKVLAGGAKGIERFARKAGSRRSSRSRRAACRRSAARRRSHPSSTCSRWTRSTRRWPSTTAWTRVSRAPSSPTASAAPSASSATRAATAGSRT